MKKYYFNDGNAQYGPFTLEELKAQINRETAIWYEGMGDWMLAKDVPEVAGVLPPPIVKAASPPPIKPAAPPAQETNATTDYKNDPIVLRSINYSEKKSSKAGWWILGGSVACIFLFLWVTGFFYTRPHYDPCVDNTMTNDEFISSVKIGVDYRAVPLGGVRDVVVTVSNNLYDDVDDATIIVSYIRQDGSSDSSEIINTGTIKGTEVKTFSANGANRGVKAVVYFGSATVNGRCFTYMQPDS